MSDGYSLENKRVFVAGHRGMVGSAIVRRLARETVEVLTVPRAELDLRDVEATARWLKDRKPDVVFLAAAKVGGILANDSFPADFLADNLAIQQAVIEGSLRADVEKLVFLGSSCIYPKLAPQPIREDSLLTGPLEPTNEWYAIAKIAGLKLCAAHRRQHGRDFVSAMPTNLYGPNDNFDLKTSHVLPALMRKIHEAKLSGSSEVVLWGSGTPRREFLHADDLADALIHVAKHYSDEAPINIGTGEDLEIRELAALLAGVIGYEGRFVHDTTKPDGTPRKLLDVGKLHGLGWRHRIELPAGVASVYEMFKATMVGRA